MVKDTDSRSKFFISADLGASCLGALSLYFFLAVVVASSDQYQFIHLSDSVRRWMYQFYFILVLGYLYLQGWRPLLGFDTRTARWGGWVLAVYALILWALDRFCLFKGYTSQLSSSALQFSETVGLSILVAPVVEELFFRDALFRAFFSRWPKVWASILFSSFFFMVAHQSFYGGAFLLGILNAVFFIQTQNIWLSIFFHSLSNLSIYFIPVLYPHLFSALRDGGWLKFFYRF